MHGIGGIANESCAPNVGVVLFLASAHAYTHWRGRDGRTYRILKPGTLWYICLRVMNLAPIAVESVSGNNRVVGIHNL